MHIGPVGPFSPELPSFLRYDYFKSELLKTKYFEDNIYCHFTASFAAGTVATTVCSPADVIKVCREPTLV